MALLVVCNAGLNPALLPLFKSAMHYTQYIKTYANTGPYVSPINGENSGSAESLPISLASLKGEKGP